MMAKRIEINRAPVLTLWGTVVAERLGYDHDAALTLGRAVAGLNAQAKGRRLGVFGEPQGKEKEPAARPAEEPFTVAVLGRMVPATRTEQGIRATEKGRPMDPQSVARYLDKKFGAALAEVQAAMEALARSYKPEQLALQAYALYERFRPTVPEGMKGWGAAGELDLDRISALARKDE